MSQDEFKTCTGCGAKKSLNDFSPRNGGVLGRASRCRPCRRADRAKRANAIEHKRRQRYHDDEETRTRVNMAGKRWRQRNIEYINLRQVYLRRQMRLEVLSWYGNKCECCGEDNLGFLTIDHINGGGTKERKATGQANFLRVLYSAGERLNGYQLLCYNCNCARAVFGICPHQVEDAFSVGIPPDFALRSQ